MTELFDSSGNKVSTDALGQIFIGEHKTKPPQPLFTKAELEEFKRLDAARELRDLNAPYLGYQKKPEPLTDRQRLVREVAYGLVGYAMDVPQGGL